MSKTTPDAILNRDSSILANDISQHEDFLSNTVKSSRFLVLGGAGTIGQAVTKEIFKRNPKVLHVIDISENNLVELVRDLRSSQGYITGDFQTYALDIGSVEYKAFEKQSSGYDYILNLSALKHVRSEKDAFTLMRMINTNIINTIDTLDNAIGGHAKKYFCVSTDKAANPVNMMGASKRIMELFLFNKSNNIDISTARFANVAFSDGSLLHGFIQRIVKQQPIVAPKDIRRYFITPEESGQLCLMSCLLGNNNEIFFPKLSEKITLVPIIDIAKRFIIANGYEPQLCDSEDEARQLVKELPAKGKWPLLGSVSDTTGEKEYEEFYSDNEELDLARFESLGVIKYSQHVDDKQLTEFLEKINTFKAQQTWSKSDVVNEFNRILKEFNHLDKGKYLDGKM